LFPTEPHDWTSTVPSPSGAPSREYPLPKIRHWYRHGG
jgi:hypothetical protein